MAQGKQNFDDVFEKRYVPPGSYAKDDVFARCPPPEMLAAFKKDESLLSPLESGIIRMHSKSCEKCRAIVEQA